MASENDNGPKIVSDDDWKEQAKKAKEKLAQDEAKAAAEASSSGGGDNAGAKESSRGPLPAANFVTLLNSMVMQAMFALGRIGDPRDGKTHVDLEMAKFQIDTLQVLEDKTKGNLTEDEGRALGMALHELRMQYVQLMQS